ncbi:YfgM family protein [Cronobacter dublinensis]|uniref:YfgM family protein n=1 Tax=Cronobacter dublinensis TaxID=413497 RepID=UPI000CFB0F2F|nr:YfgM family protein [Cronobacter dublinensis]
MEIYENENEQLDAVKRFFAENGKALAVGVVLGIGALVGWRFWNGSQVDSARETSLHYQNVMTDVRADDPKTLSAAELFVAQNQNSYGALASLELAQRYVDKNDLNKAAQQLQQGIENAKDENLRSLMNLRLARIQIQQKQADAALKTLDGVKGENWSAMVADLRGDALLSKGDKQGARDAWSKGVNDKNSPALGDMMQMKINNLSI